MWPPEGIWINVKAHSVLFMFSWIICRGTADKVGPHNHAALVQFIDQTQRIFARRITIEMLFFLDDSKGCFAP